MSGWDSRLEKGPDGQKCRTCIYRAANRYGPWGCGYADVTGQSKLAAFPDAVILPTLVIGFNNAVLAEASMSYLGIGVKPPDVSLGYMLSESQAYMSAAPWYMLACGLSIVWLILGVSLIGEGLQRKGGV